MEVDTIVTDQVTPQLTGSEKVSAATSEKIWIDLDNSPHVPFFLPIMEELRHRGYQVVVTARNSYQVCELLELHKLQCDVIGSHWGRHRLLKILGTCFRALRLIPFAAGQKPDLAVSHGSRAQMLTCKVLRIPTICMFDYEFTQKMDFLHSLWYITPEFIPDLDDPQAKTRTRKYPGLKEDVYVPRFRPDPSLREQLGFRADQIVATVRPPATEAHYHNPEAEVLLNAVMNLFVEHPEIRVVLLPRNDRQAAVLEKTWRSAISSGQILIPKPAVDGLNLSWSSDFVVSGGGTMNREAAALGVPVYSIFRGQIGAVDRYLVREGRLTLIENVEDVRTKITVAPRDPVKAGSSDRPALQAIVNNIVSILGLVSQTRSQRVA
jgi:predicted glycosyltransferase